MSQTEYPEPTVEQAALFARVRRMMLIASVTTAVAIAAVLVFGIAVFVVDGATAAPCLVVTLTGTQGGPSGLQWFGGGGRSGEVAV